MSNLQEQRSGHGPRSVWGRLVAAVLGFALVLTGSVVFATGAQAASGTVNSIDLVTVYDGAQVPNDFDDGAANGIVATNDVVGFRWELNATDLSEGVLTQTLPEGWRWDPSSLTSLDSSSSAYQSSYTISPDGRTLTATVSIGSGTGNPSVVAFGTLKAIPSSDVPNDSVYTPEVSVAVDDVVQTAVTDPITVRSAPRADAVKTRAANNILSTFDFGDGAGAVPARYIDFVVTLNTAAGKIGAQNTTLQQPVRLSDDYTLQAPDGFGDGEFVAQVVAKSEPGATVDLAQSGQSLDLAFDGFTQIPNASATVRFWIRDADVPNDAQGALKVINTIAPQDWVDGDGEPVAEEPSGNTAEGTVMKPPTGTGTVAYGKEIMLFNDQSGDFSLTADPGGPGQPFRNVSEQEISKGSTVTARFYVRPGLDLETGAVTTATDLVAYDFWNPAEQQIVDGADVYVGQNNGTAPLDSADYTIQYTSGTDSANPEANTWVNSIAAAGGVSQVSGMRVAYTAGTWGDGLPASTGYFLVAAPMTVVADLGGSARDTARTTFTDLESNPVSTTVNRFVNVGSYRLAIDKTVNRSSIVSGSSLTYTLAPTITRALGAIEDIDVYDLTVVDQLPAGLVSVDTSAVDPAWQVTRSGTAASGLQLTFTYTGTARTGEAVPAITYGVTTSVQAPASRTLVNSATVSALGTTQSARARTDATTTSIFQAEVITEEKVVVGEEQIEVGDPQVSWEGRWFNFQTISQGASSFVDVLPYNGDARGTSFSGTAKLASAMITDGNGAAAAPGYGTLQYTTAPAATVYAAEVDDPSITWVDADGVDLSTIDGITALRVNVADFASGQAGVGGLLVTMDVEGQQDGDQYVNTINGLLGVSGKLGRSNPARIDVVDASISGVVWEDANADGVRDASETLIGDATVRLLDASGAEIATAQTGADGSYTFPALHSGDYTVVVDTSTLGYPANFVVVNTYDLDGDHNSDSGVISLAKAEDRGLVDFGYVTRVSDIDLTKSGKLAGDAVAGDWIDWSFTITNVGENPLTSVELVDHLEGVVDLQVQWTGTAGELAAGASVPATARTQLTQEDVDRGFVVNTATVTGLDPNQTEVDDPADATVVLPEGGSLLFQKTGKMVGDAVVGGEVEWGFTLTNTGNVTLDGLAIADELEGLGEITWGEWPGEAFTLEPGDSVTATAPSTLTQSDVDAGCVTNVASAEGTTPGDRAVPSGEDDASVCFTPESGISLVKRTNGVEVDEAPGVQLTVGDAVEWSYEVTNTGSTTLRNVQLVDDQEGVIAPPEGFDGTLAPGESVTFIATGIATSGQYHNVAVVTAATPAGGNVSADDESWYHAEARPGLSITGGAAPWLAGAIGLLLVGGGAALWLMRRRRA
ncbi:carboxypeptidase regulatory-like domain-containing protein [Leucobacter rhizosphaerae]|uniref:Carboxypeptidase regulatory-like domain-containing protein n=1 Tax=Leucobacter rhizosphaerae TaxID=2932245 RepID=A0ABY4FUF4_9MICO|nr:SdrD B-like domain-containing protein [Leucobacter rhizosphaerae]UOQ59814.1 carboxypeptidase regulatory-like domain-containing protein [Leucobacter rhizosphaerae]